LSKNAGSMRHRFSVRSYDPRNVWFTIFGYVTATLAIFFVGRDAENTEAEPAGAKEAAVLQEELIALREEMAQPGTPFPALVGLDATWLNLSDSLSGYEFHWSMGDSRPDKQV